MTMFHCGDGDLWVMWCEGFFDRKQVFFDGRTVLIRLERLPPYILGVPPNAFLQTQDMPFLFKVSSGHCRPMYSYKGLCCRFAIVPSAFHLVMMDLMVLRRINKHFDWFLLKKIYIILICTSWHHSPLGWVPWSSWQRLVSDAPCLGVTASGAFQRRRLYVMKAHVTCRLHKGGHHLTNCVTSESKRLH